MTAPMSVSLDERPPATQPLGIVAVCERPERAEAAVARLEAAGFDPGRIAVVACEEPSGEQLLGCAATQLGLRFWGRAGPTWARLAESLAGAAVMFVPFLGHVVMLGAVVEWLDGDRPRHGVPEGATRLWRLLARVGVDPRVANSIEAALRDSRILILLAGSPTERAAARTLLRSAADRAALHR